MNGQVAFVLVTIYLVVVAGASLVAFVAYGMDKRWAKLGSRRVPEQTLHVVALLGGWPGALAGQRVFRHKTKKVRFRAVFWLVVVVHVAVVIGVVYLLIS